MNAKVKKTANKSDTAQATNVIEPSDYHTKISKIAYFNAQRRNFEPGQEFEDWLEAEREFLQIDGY